MAYEIIKRLKELNEIRLLEKLAADVSKRERKRGKQHEVFEPSFDWKECNTDKFIIQKLDYMHDNPCRGVWDLVDNPELYVHSSARFYATGEQGIYWVTHFGELEDIDLTKTRSPRVETPSDSERR
jgi:hypothetical protein